MQSSSEVFSNSVVAVGERSLTSSEINREINGDKNYNNRKWMVVRAAARKFHVANRSESVCQSSKRQIKFICLYGFFHFN